VILGRLRIATLLACLAGPPLLAFAVQSGASTWSYRQADVQFERVLAGQKLAMAGVKLARALPAEAFAPPEALAERRKLTDLAFDNVAAAYQMWRASAGDDATMARDLDRIAERRGHLADYRAHIDAKDPDGMFLALAVLQPAAGAALDLARRLSETIDDFPIARSIAGLHALLQFNDATLIYIHPGEALFDRGTLDKANLGYVLHATNLQQTYAPILRELLPADIVVAHDAFEISSDGAYIAKVEGYIQRGERGDLPASDKDHWDAATKARVGLNARLIEQATAGLEQLTQARKSETHRGFLIQAATFLTVLVAGVGLCLLALSTLRGLFANIAARMRALADGDKTSPIPLLDRKDDLGDIARALEVFRHGAIRNDELEAGAVAQRAQAERTQRDAHVAAEREAEAWMEAATRALAEGLKRLANGDLAFELKEKLAERFERLRADFNVSVRTLRETLTTVGAAAETLSGRSEEISNSADVLAAAAARQSSALAETSESLIAIAADVQATAARAGETRASVGDTRQRADHADAVMRKAIAAMEKIETSAAQIARINGVVDEIAFQTNLLALNAGVEAARAGESGRGFAVVAQEVRELALRSAAAAKEIGQLVSTTGASIGEGVKLVHETGEELRAIGARVTKVDEDVRAIAHSAGEQAKGLAAVTETLAGLDRATRENAEMVQQLNQAGGDLAAGSQELNALMSRFQIDERRTARAA